jgi:hypothetical protein
MQKSKVRIYYDAAVPSLSAVCGPVFVYQLMEMVCGGEWEYMFMCDESVQGYSGHRRLYINWSPLY